MTGFGHKSSAANPLQTTLCANIVACATPIFACIRYRLVTCGTVEEKIYRKQVFKNGLADAIIHKKQSSTRYFNRNELKALFCLDDGGQESATYVVGQRTAQFLFSLRARTIRAVEKDAGL